MYSAPCSTTLRYLCIPPGNPRLCLEHFAVGPTTAGQASFMIFLADLEFALTLGFIFCLSFLDYATHQITSLSWLNESYSLLRVKSLSHRQEMVAAEEAK